MMTLCILRVTLYLTVAGSLGSSATDNSSIPCNNLQCRNNSVCKITKQGNQTQFECRCHDGWVGKQCQARITLSAVSVLATSIKLFVSNSLSENDSHHSDAEILTFTYTLQYWQQNHSDTCNIIPRQISTSVTVSGLLPESDYVFCAKSLNVDWCYIPSDSNFTAIPLSNCVSVRTEKWTDREAQVLDFPFQVIIPVLIVVLLCLVALFVIIVSFKRRWTCVQCFHDRKIKKKRKRNDSCATLEELVQYSTTPPSVRVVVHPPSSPGKPKHQLSRRAQGYAAFSAHNEHRLALTTVLEYMPPCQTLGEEEGGDLDAYVSAVDDYSTAEEETAFISYEHG